MAIPVHKTLMRKKNKRTEKEKPERKSIESPHSRDITYSIHEKGSNKHVMVALETAAHVHGFSLTACDRWLHCSALSCRALFVVKMWYVCQIVAHKAKTVVHLAKSTAICPPRKSRGKP